MQIRSAIEGSYSDGAIALLSPKRGAAIGILSLEAGASKTDFSNLELENEA